MCISYQEIHIFLLHFDASCFLFLVAFGLNRYLSAVLTFFREPCWGLVRYYKTKPESVTIRLQFKLQQEGCNFYGTDDLLTLQGTRQQ